MGLQNGRVEILGLLTWESWEKWHLSAALMGNHKEYYKDKDGDFPQVQAVMNFVSLTSLFMPMAHLCIESVPTMH
jgi:hypothetical protein